MHRIVLALLLLGVPEAVGCAGPERERPAPSAPALSPAPAPPSARAARGSPRPAVDLHAIARVIEQEQRSFRACYEQGMQRDPHLTGRVVMRLVIEADGTVSEINDVSDQRGGAPLPGRPSANVPLPDLAVRACLAAVLAKLKLPVPSGPVTIHWPMYFSPDKREEVTEELQ